MNKITQLTECDKQDIRSSLFPVSSISQVLTQGAFARCLTSTPARHQHLVASWVGTVLLPSSLVSSASLSRSNFSAHPAIISEKSLPGSLYMVSFLAKTILSFLPLQDTYGMVGDH